MYTPSAYTLTNTTRPHESNAKSASPVLRWMARGKIGILAKEQTVYNCTIDRITDKHTTRWRQNRGPRFTVTRRREWIVAEDPRSRPIHELNQSCPGSRACNPARSHTFHTQVVQSSTSVADSTADTLAPGACINPYTFYTCYTLYTLYTLYTPYTLYTWLHTLRICKANWFCKLSKKSGRHSKNQNDSAFYGTFSTNVKIFQTHCGNQKYVRTFTTDPFEKIHARIVSDPLSLFKRKGIVSNASERGFTVDIQKAIYSKDIWDNKKKKKMQEKRARKSKQNSRPLAYVWMQNRWWNGVCVSYADVTPCIPELTLIYPDVTWHILRWRMSK